jgi:hypothetical protein
VRPFGIMCLWCNYSYYHDCYYLGGAGVGTRASPVERSHSHLAGSGLDRWSYCPPTHRYVIESHGAEASCMIHEWAWLFCILVPCCSNSVLGLGGRHLVLTAAKVKDGSAEGKHCSTCPGRGRRRLQLLQRSLRGGVWLRFLWRRNPGPGTGNKEPFVAGAWGALGGPGSASQSCCQDTPW